MPHAPCPMPHAPCPRPHALDPITEPLYVLYRLRLVKKQKICFN
ncbi:MAG: hypothetical protein WBL95_17535 [Microcoleus sp.]